MSGHPTEVAILGTGMTDMSRRDLEPETMTEQAVGAALGDAGLAPSDVGLVIMGNAMGGPAERPGLRARARPGCASSASATPPSSTSTTRAPAAARRCTSPPWPRASQDRPVLALGVEKMWTGNRGETMAGIEDGLPDRVPARPARPAPTTDDNPAGSILMGLNNRWAAPADGATPGTTLRQIAAAAVKAFDHAARNPLAQCQRTVTVEEVLDVAPGRRRPHPAHVQLVHRRRRRRGPGRPVRGRAGARRRVSSGRSPARATASSTTTNVSPRPPRPPGRSSAGAPATSTSSNCTTPRRPRSSSPSSRSASSAPARPVRPPRPAPPGWTRPGLGREPERRAGRPRAPPRRHRAGPGGRVGQRSSAAAPATARCRSHDWASPSTPAGSSTGMPGSSASTESAPGRAREGDPDHRLGHRGS